jgi:DNA-binding CsgD family transcriptional regulator
VKERNAENLATGIIDLREIFAYSTTQRLLQPGGSADLSDSICMPPWRRSTAWTQPWTGRASSELAATGESVSPRSQNGVHDLTPRELQPALIVGRGATNREANGTLFVSPKTVEAHLHRIYVKLGIRSRTELARLLVFEQMLD